MKPLEGMHRIDSRSHRIQVRRAALCLQALTLRHGGMWRHPDQAAFPGGLTITLTVGTHDTGPHHATLRHPDPTLTSAIWLGRITGDTMRQVLDELDRRVAILCRDIRQGALAY